MKTFQLTWEGVEGWQAYDGDANVQPQWVIFFGQREVMAETKAIQELLEKYPEAAVFGCSSSGEIIGDTVMDETLVATAVSFEKTKVESTSILIDQYVSSYAAGLDLAAQFPKEDLKAIFVISDGHVVNGSDLVMGMREQLPEEVVITGGLAGDGDKFEKTLVAFNGAPQPGLIAALGVYGDSIRIGHGSVGGWDNFGPERTITKSQDNVLYELDGKPALDLYKSYLGEDAERLPSSALEFPLSIRSVDQSDGNTVRTILSIDEENNSMTFAGNMPEGHIAQLMMANFDQLIHGAQQAAQSAKIDTEEVLGSKLALMVSCVGRKIVMGQHTPEEVEAVAEVLGEDVHQIGFYSYGEISPHYKTGYCELHNQTMTITYLFEV
ncbi:MAG: FIST N-terminal domain-containing protein [Bacteroidota bacterium]